MYYIQIFNAEMQPLEYKMAWEYAALKWEYNHVHDALAVINACKVLAAQEKMGRRHYIIFNEKGEIAYACTY